MFMRSVNPIERENNKLSNSSDVGTHEAISSNLGFCLLDSKVALKFTFAQKSIMEIKLDELMTLLSALVNVKMFLSQERKIDSETLMALVDEEYELVMEKIDSQEQPLSLIGRVKSLSCHGGGTDLEFHVDLNRNPSSFLS